MTRHADVELRVDVVDFPDEPETAPPEAIVQLAGGGLGKRCAPGGRAVQTLHMGHLMNVSDRTS